jgi:alkylhydroperoxidase/carboxymuconolactone decarboxylase family protein YurZ
MLPDILCHVERLNFQSTKYELIEVITHLAFYAGWPTANTAVTIARHIFEEHGV